MKVLIIAAHPDDEVLGCGGTIAKMTEANHEVYVLILGEGITSRSTKRNRSYIEKDLKDLKQSALSAGKLLGVKNIFFGNFQDNMFDSFPLLSIVKFIEKILSKLKPDIIYTHYKNDLNIDHKITFDAVLTATRPIENNSVKEIYSFEILSSTEWNYPISFSPNVFFDISTTIEMKLKALSLYKREIRNPPHPRSLEVVRLNAQMWGAKVGLNYAEVFQVVRIIK